MRLMTTTTNCLGKTSSQRITVTETLIVLQQISNSIKAGEEVALELKVTSKDGVITITETEEF